MGLEGLRDCLLHVFVRRALSRSFDQFCFVCFCSGLSLEDFYLVTEMSRYNLGVTFFKTFDREVRSDQFSDNRWILEACVDCLYFSVKFDLCSFVKRQCNFYAVLSILCALKPWTCLYILTYTATQSIDLLRTGGKI